MKTAKKQKNTYRVWCEKAKEWTDIFITASNYDDARIEFYQVMAEQGLNPKHHGMLRIKK